MFSAWPSPSAGPRPSARSSATVADGIALLTIYSLGLGVPYLLAAVFTDPVCQTEGVRTPRTYSANFRWGYHDLYGRRHDDWLSLGLRLLAPGDVSGVVCNRLSSPRGR